MNTVRSLRGANHMGRARICELCNIEHSVDVTPDGLDVCRRCFPLEDDDDE